MVTSSPNCTHPQKCVYLVLSNVCSVGLFKKGIEMRKLPVEERRNLPIASTRLERAEFEQLEHAARQHGLSRSEFLRQAIQGALATQERNGEVNNG